MPFTTKYSADFAAGILSNVQVVLERDINDALSEIDGTLPAIIDWTTPIEIALSFPCLYLEPSDTDAEQADDDSYLKEEHQLIVSVAIVGGQSDVDALKSQITKYVKAIDRVLRSMSIVDLTGGLNSAKARPVWEVTQHRYSKLRGNAGSGEQMPTIFRRDAQLLLTVQILER